MTTDDGLSQAEDIDTTDDGLSQAEDVDAADYSERLAPLGRPVRRGASMRDRVVDEVRRQIVRGELLPGERITEWAVANGMGVSRGPVREGLRELEREGLVRTFRNRGAVVMDMSDDELLGLLLPVRLTIEHFASVEATSRLDDALIGELEAILADMDLAAGNQDPDGVTDADLAFHRRIVDASEQQHAMHLWRSIYPRIQAQLHRIGRGRRTSLVEVPGEHRLLLEILVSGEQDQLAEVLEAHILGDAKKFMPHREDIDRSGWSFGR